MNVNIIMLHGDILNNLACRGEKYATMQKFPLRVSGTFSSDKLISEFYA